MKTTFFTPHGLLKYINDDPTAKRLYDAIRLSFGSQNDAGVQLSTAPASFWDDLAATTSLAVGTATELLEKAWDQTLALRCSDLIAEMESEYGITPSPDDRLLDRQRVLAARKRLGAGNNRAEVQEALKVMLGDAFHNVRTTQPAERQVYPAALGDQPQNLQPEYVQRKLVTLPGANLSTDLGVAKTVVYVPVLPLPDADGEQVLVGGDRLVVEPENLDACETVEILDVGTDGSDLTLTAVFSNAHMPGCAAHTFPFPLWVTTQRRILVVLAASAAADPETRRKVHELLERMLRTVTTWDIAGLSGVDTIGPFRVEEGMLNVTTIGQYAVPPA